ncbi:MAG: hypothetical protein DRO98_08520 [Archaeoglobales archaeon]|nr:MAG: hypothetical protein DRO98_08520 [Archaeoglobales archaeon]
MVEKRNIVLISIDSLRADHCSFMGYEKITTPTIDKMARKGLFFENAIAASVPTAPSIFSSFTGEFPPIDSFSKKAESWRSLFATNITIAFQLRKLGYCTLSVHKHPWASKYFGFDKGFDYFSSLGDPTKAEKKEKMSEFRRKLDNILDFLTKKGESTPWESYYEEIIDVVTNAKRPYFLWVFLLDTHWPYLSTKRFSSHTSYVSLLYKYWKIGRKRMLYEKKEKIIIDAYDKSIRYADTFVKRLWEDLKDDDPIFIIHSDHGDGFGEHGFYYHYVPKLYEELIHVPLIIYNADVKGKIKNPISLRGMASSIIELIGEENIFPCKSFLNGSEDYVISKVFNDEKRVIAVRMRDWKFISGQKDKDELYNLKKDPYEQENVIEEHPDLVREVKDIIKSHIKHEEETRRIRIATSRLKNKIL